MKFNILYLLFSVSFLLVYYKIYFSLPTKNKIKKLCKVLACIFAFKFMSNKNSTENTNASSISNTITNNNSSTNINNENKTPSNTSGLRKEFKEAMDSYETFMDEYIAFMKKYTNSNATAPEMIKDYGEYMKKYADAVDAFEKWENTDLNKEEAKYYVAVQTRVTQKLLNASIDVQYQ